MLKAYYTDTDVVIDDITDPVQYNKLRELEYALLDKKHRLLSDVLM